ncbi:MAG: cytochrome c oxidase assembly protein [Chthoniobacterales bacterium]
MDVSDAVLGSWSIRLEPTVGLLLTAFFYWRGWLKLHRQVPHRFTPWRLVSFTFGLMVLFVAISSPLDAFAGLLLEVHMIQHLLLTMVAPPLMLLGFPYLPILSGLPRRVTREALAPFLTWPPFKRFCRWLTNPAVCWSSFVAISLGWHLPVFYELTLRSSGWHTFEHICFLAAGLLFWWPIVQPWPSHRRWPRWAMIPYLLLADLQNTALSAFFSFSDRVLYPTYEKVPQMGNLTPLADQNIAGAIMWIVGAVAYLIPAGVITMEFLSPPRRRMAKQIARSRMAATQANSRVARLRQSPAFRGLRGRSMSSVIFRSRFFRRGLQTFMLLLAIMVAADGFWGPQIAPMNLAGVLPWSHWRGFTVLALLAVGNFFCMACPFTLARDIGRRVLPAQWIWPRALRSKWLAVALIVSYLWAYEAFNLWNSPWLTAWIIVGYFSSAIIIDGLFRGASFCKYVCPIGQFHFIQSLTSPFEIKFRDPEVCRNCKTFDCIRGNEMHRGCELRLFQPKKSGNLDCTFCLDCIKACPHENVGIVPTVPGRELWNDRQRSSIGRFSNRLDLAMLALVLVFGAFANAAGMAAPVIEWLSRWQIQLGFISRPAALMVFFAGTVVAAPGALIAVGAWISRVVGKIGSSFKEVLCTFAMSLIPIGAGMWLAHFIFHLFTASHTPVPVIQRIASELRVPFAGHPDWAIRSWTVPELLDFEMLFLDLGLLLTLYAAWRVAQKFDRKGSKAVLIFAPWAVIATLLFCYGVWILFQPMEMRGTMMH